MQQSDNQIEITGRVKSELDISKVRDALNKVRSTKVHQQLVTNTKLSYSSTLDFLKILKEVLID